MAALADGVVVGSAVVTAMEEAVKDGRDPVEAARGPRARARGRDDEGLTCPWAKRACPARISKADRSTLVALVAENLTRLTERDALQALRHPHASEAMIEEILTSKTLLAFRGVRRLVAAHPLTPRHAALRCLEDLLWRDLLDIGREPRTPPPVRVAANRKLEDALRFLAVGEKVAVARFASVRALSVAPRRSGPARPRSGAREFAARVRGPPALARDRASPARSARVPRARPALDEPARGPDRPPDTSLDAPCRGAFPSDVGIAGGMAKARGGSLVRRPSRGLRARTARKRPEFR